MENNKDQIIRGLKRLEMLELCASIIDDLSNMGASEAEIAELLVGFDAITNSTAGAALKLSRDNEPEPIR